jgi:peptide deformylase
MHGNRMKIVKYPHPSLRHPAVPLTAIDKKVRLIVGEMLDLMYEGRGLGLAGPQVALPYQVFVMNLKSDPTEKAEEKAFINPVYFDPKGSIEGEEGCLSFPDLFQKVRRAKAVKFQAYDLDGKLITGEVMDLEARVWQHEVDHLRGELFIDKMGAIAKLASRGTLKQFERDYKRAQERGEYPPDNEMERLLKALESQA